MAEENEELVKSVGEKFASWAASLPPEEQQILRSYMSRQASDEVRGYEATWWQGNAAWEQAWSDTYWQK